MKKVFISLFLCLTLVMGLVPFTAFAQEETSEYTFEYIKRDVSTGDGYIIVEFSGERVKLSGDTATTQIPKGVDVTVTIKAQVGSAITAVVFDGAPMGFGDPAPELNMTINNFSDNHSLKITYAESVFTCGVSSVGNGKVSILNPASKDSSVTVPMGENFEFYAEADEGHEIVSIKVNDEYVDLAKYGQTDVIKITRFNMELPEICENTQVFVTFSGNKVEYVTLTLEWNDGGKCNYGENTVKVIKGNIFGIVIEPDEGYKVARIVDDNKTVENFTGKTYYTDELSADRKIKVEFAKAEKITMYGDVNNDKKVNVLDATLIQKAVAGIVDFSAEQKLFGDVDDDTRISVKDATAIQKLTAGIIQKFPAEV